MQILEATPNRFQGIELDPAALPSDPEEFRTRLSASLREWKREAFKLVWINIPIERAALIPVATKRDLHFTTREQTTFCSPNNSSPMPSYPNTPRITSARAESSSTNAKNSWSSANYTEAPQDPTTTTRRCAAPGRHIADCVQREVFEETGVRTKFEKLVCFRHWHGYRYDKSDIYFVCRLSPLSEAISIQAEEIEECLWLPVRNISPAKLSAHLTNTSSKPLSKAPASPTWKSKATPIPSVTKFSCPMAWQKTSESEGIRRCTQMYADEYR